MELMEQPTQGAAALVNLLTRRLETEALGWLCCVIRQTKQSQLALGWQRPQLPAGRLSLQRLALGLEIYLLHEDFKMSHYAFLNQDNTVVDVIAGCEEGNMDWEQFYSMQRGLACKRTSYRTRGGQHPGGRPFRKNYAGIGYTYDSVRDAFIPPQPFTGWVLNEDTCLWQEPASMPVTP
jgi:hypothetical protein